MNPFFRFILAALFGPMRHIPSFDLSKASLCLALALALVCASSAQGSMIYSGIQDIAIATTFNGTYVDVENLNNATNHGTDASTITGQDVNFFFGGVGEFNQANFQPVRFNAADPYSAIQNLAMGSLIDSASTFATGVGGSGDVGSEHVGLAANQFAPGTEGYMGFLLNGTMYGWMRVTLTNDDAGAIIHDWAYDDSGAAITTGLVPEPGRAMLLMFGSLFCAMRRRRTNKAFQNAGMS